MNDKTLSIIIKAQDQASKVLAGIGGEIEELGAKALHFAKIAATALGAATVAAVGFGVKSAASFEQTRIGLENMLGSADAAKKVLKEVSVFAAQTPFEFPELAGAVKQLVAFGFSGGDAVKTMKQLGDVSAAVGTPIGDLSYLMGTLRTQGRAFTIDIRQFAQRGIPIYEYLAKVLNTDEKALSGLIEAGKIGFPEVQKAFELMTAEGGKFHGAMAAQSKSLSGLWSTLKDNVGLAMREMVGISQEGDVKAGSLFDRMRTGAAQLIGVMEKMDWEKISNRVMDMAESSAKTLVEWGKKIKVVALIVADYLNPKVDALWATITTRLIPAFMSLWREAIQPLLPVLGGALVGALGFAIDALNTMGRALSALMGWIASNRTLVITLITTIGAFYAVLRARDAFMAFDAALATMRMSFVGAAFTAGGLTSAIAAIRTIMAATSLFMMGPFGIAIAAATALMGLLAGAWLSSRYHAEALKTAQDNLRTSTDELRTAQDMLRDAHLREEGAALAVERAQQNYNATVAQFGPNSLEAREALHNLKQAQEDLTRAQDNTKTSIQRLSEKQTEVARNKELIRTLQEVASAADGITRSADGAVSSINRLNQTKVNTNSVGQKIDLSPFIKPAGRATGGPVRANEPYIVGEHEPELFIPNTSGRIMNQAQLEAAGAGGATNNFYGNINLTTPESVDRFADRFEMGGYGVGI